MKKESLKIDKPLALIKSLIYFLSVFAFIFSISILTFYVHASKIVGHFPTYNNPDPKQLDIYGIYQPILNLTIEVWIYSLLLWLIFTIIYIVKNKRNRNWKPVIITLISQSVPFIIIFSKIFEWYVD